MAIGSSDYTAVVTLCRNALAVGGNLVGRDLVKVIDVVEHAANTLDSNPAADALDAEITTQLALWNAVGAGDSSAVYTAAVAALAPLRAAAIAGTAITNITASDALDGRPAA